MGQMCVCVCVWGGGGSQALKLMVFQFTGFRWMRDGLSTDDYSPKSMLSACLMTVWKVLPECCGSVF